MSTAPYPLMLNLSLCNLFKKNPKTSPNCGLPNCVGSSANLKAPWTMPVWSSQMNENIFLRRLPLKRLPVKQVITNAIISPHTTELLNSLSLYQLVCVWQRMRFFHLINIHIFRKKRRALFNHLLLLGYAYHVVTSPGRWCAEAR